MRPTTNQIGTKCLNHALPPAVLHRLLFCAHFASAEECFRSDDYARRAIFAWRRPRFRCKNDRVETRLLNCISPSSCLTAGGRCDDRRAICRQSPGRRVHSSLSVRPAENVAAPLSTSICSTTGDGASPVTLAVIPDSAHREPGRARQYHGELIAYAKKNPES